MSDAWATAPPSDATVRSALLATGFNYTEDLWWRPDDDGNLRLLIRCNDLFHWGCSDCEEITDANVHTLAETIAECEAITGNNRAYAAPLLWCCRQRQMRPQGAYYKSLDEALWPLFDAVGPPRAVGMLNPRPQSIDEAS